MISATYEAELEARINSYKETLEDHKRLVKEFDVALNGENAAESPSLCDVVKQALDIIKKSKREIAELKDQNERLRLEMLPKKKGIRPF